MDDQYEDESEQCAHHPFADLFQAALQAATADDKACHRDNGHPEHHFHGAREHLAKDAGRLFRRKAVKIAGQEAEEVIEHPAGDGGVVHHQQYTAHHAEPAVDVPLAALWFQRLVGAAGGTVPGAADGQLHGQDRQAHQHQENQVEQDKDTAAVLACDGGEAPDVADADGTARADKDEAKA